MGMPAIPSFLLSSLTRKLGLSLLALIAIGLLIVYGINRWNNFKDDLIQQGYDEGYSVAVTDITDRVNRAREQNERLTVELEETTRNFTELRRRRASERAKNEQEIADRINTEIADIMDFADKMEICRLPENVVKDRNAIRALGPSEETE